MKLLLVSTKYHKSFSTQRQLGVNNLCHLNGPQRKKNTEVLPTSTTDFTASKHVTPLQSVTCSRCRKEEQTPTYYTSLTWFSVLGLLLIERLLCLRNGFFSRQNSLRTELERRSKICLHLSKISCPIFVSHSNIKSLNRFSPWQVIWMSILPVEKKKGKCSLIINNSKPTATPFQE